MPAESNGPQWKITKPIRRSLLKLRKYKKQEYFGGKNEVRPKVYKKNSHVQKELIPCIVIPIS
ncbi:hypothetical protein CIL05_10980 [Virgibacillus profundi]|uniref:Uncharacterized protein n=1 Tax=Virgibacillus profundi TaxID=2024555 RepID=A0A2A2IE08_9BACI|nr:hypothetical protein CIL05_10980 [Virgibacillus profundi]PXY53555.1 hypothetical protein CIT14_11090 [Virgibacillus profundi]